jgi:hypothetical protein
MRIIHAVWEFDNLGVNAWEIALDAEDTPEAFAEEEQKLVKAGAQYLVVKTPVNCPRLLFGLPRLGYALVETVFHVAIRRGEYRPPALLARFDRGLSVAERANGPELRRICDTIRGGVFTTDRIAIDPAFGERLSGIRYANWLAGMVEGGGRAYEVLLGKPGEAGRPLGFFVITRVDASTVDPVLMGLYNEREDRGMGALLHKKTMDTCFTWDCDKLQSTIVSNNARVLRVYVNAGAAITDTLYTYVKHAG